MCRNYYSFLPLLRAEPRNLSPKVPRSANQGAPIPTDTLVILHPRAGIFLQNVIGGAARRGDVRGIA